MVSFFRQKPKDYVSSIDHLLDERSRYIASHEGLHVDAIYPLCVQINFEVNTHAKHLIKTISDEDKEKVLSQYRLLLAAAAVLSYELSKRPSVSFPKPSTDQVKHVPKDILSNLKKVSWQARRLADPGYYDMMGNIFEDNLKNLESTVASGKIEVDIDATYQKLYAAN